MIGCEGWIIKTPILEIIFARVVIPKVEVDQNVRCKR